MQEVFLGRDLNGASIPFYQSWSLGVEEKFYLVWPLLAFLWLRRRPRWRIPVTIALALVSRFSGDVLASYHHILLGCLLALLLEVAPVKAAFGAAGSVGLWGSFAALLLVHLFVEEQLLYSVVTACFLGSLLTTKTPLNRILSCPPLVGLGKISYGFYLVHILCLNVAEKIAHGSPVPSLLLSIVISAGVAYILHRVVEAPLISVGRGLAKRTIISTNPVAVIP